MKTFLSCLAIAALAALPAAAQAGGQIPVPDIKQPSLKGPIAKLPAIPDALKPGQSRAVGCIKHELYNIQSVTGMSISFMLETATGDEIFNFEGTQIKRIAPGAGLPLATTAETHRWTRLLDTLERAAAADKPLIVDYQTPSGTVFGIYVQWSEDCPD